jgi:autotransporter-associated beta strand protein
VKTALASARFVVPSRSAVWLPALFALLLFGSQGVQAANQFKSVANGYWNITSTWNVSTDGGNTWGATALIPNFNNAPAIFLTNGFTVTVTNFQTATNLMVDTGSTLVLAGTGILSSTNISATTNTFAYPILLNGGFNDANPSAGGTTSEHLNGIISGSGGVTNSGGGTLTLAGANTFTGGLYAYNGLVAGTLVNNCFGAGPITLGSASGGSVTLSTGKSPTNPITLGTGAVGTLIITNIGGATAAVYSGAINLNGDNLTVGAGGVSTTVKGGITGAGNLLLNNASTNSAGNGLILSTVSVNNTGSITLQGAGTGATVISAVIGANVTAMTNNSASSPMILSGANTYTGPTVINVGTLKAGVASVAGTSGAFGNNSALTVSNLSSALVDLAGFDTQIGSLTSGGLAGGNVTNSSATLATLTVGGDNTSPAAFGGVIESSLALTKIGFGTLVLTGNNTYTGNTVISAGTLALSGSGAITGSSSLTVNPGASLDVSAVTTGGYALSDSGTLTLSLNQTGSTLSQGQLVLGAKNLTYGGALTIVSNANSDAFVSGDSFILVTTTGTLGGWFSSVTVPALGSGLAWDTNDLATSGVLDIYNFTTNSVQTMAAIENTPTTLAISKLTSKATGQRGAVTLSSVSSASGATVSISGSNISYTPPADFIGTDMFSAVLTDGHGSMTATVVVTVSAVNAGATLSGGDNGSGNYQFTASGMPNQTYEVQVSTDGLDNWSNYEPVTAAANGVVIYTDPDPILNHASRYYRLAQP